MKILKKITGVIILIFTVLLCFPAFYAFPIQFENCKKKFEAGVVGAPGYALGFLTCLVFYFLITYFLIKLSLKLIRQRKNNIASIDEIGLKE